MIIDWSAGKAEKPSGFGCDVEMTSLCFEENNHKDVFKEAVKSRLFADK